MKKTDLWRKGFAFVMVASLILPFSTTANDEILSSGIETVDIPTFDAGIEELGSGSYDEFEELLTAGTSDVGVYDNTGNREAGYGFIASEEQDAAENEESISLENDLLNAGETALFEKGYVEIKKDVIVYKSIEGEEAGHFADDTVVYAEMCPKAENSDEEWLAIYFCNMVLDTQNTDTLILEEGYEEESEEQSNEELEKDIPAYFIQFKCVGLLDPESTEEIVTSLNAGKYIVHFHDALIPTADFVVEDIKMDDEVLEDDDVFSSSVNSLSIQTQPKDAVAYVGDTASFSVVANNATAYQWKYSKDGSTWYNCTTTYYNGCKTASMTFDALAKRNGWKFKCEITGNGEFLETNIVTLNIVDDSLKIITQPKDITVGVGETGSFEVIAANANTFQWQYSKDGATWNNCTATYYYGCKTSKVEFAALAKRNGWKFKCIISGNGETVETNVVTLNIVDNSLKILDEPVDMSANVGDSVTFSVEAQNAETYQWKYSKDGTTWYNCTITYYSGCKTDTMETEALLKRDGWKFKCVITGNGQTIETTPVTLSVIDSKLKILEEPVDVSARVGENVHLSVVAQNAETYQWKYSKDGVTWNNCTATYYPGCRADAMDFNALAKRNGWQFKCIITGKGQTVETKAITLTVVDDSLKIITDPVDITANEGEKVRFSVVAQNAESYQWQYSKNGSTWYNCTITFYEGCKSPEVEFDALQKRDGWQFKCIVTGNGETAESKPATLTVINPYIIIDDVVYEAISDTTCRVSSYNGSASSLIIPETVEGMTVIEIGEEAFMGNGTLQSIDLPDTITIIKARAFKNCTMLSSMN